MKRKLLSTWGDGVYYDVASSNNKNDTKLHVILRHDEWALCKGVLRGGVESYLGDHNAGAFPTCEVCTQLLAEKKDKAARAMGITE